VFAPPLRPRLRGIALRLSPRSSARLAPALHAGARLIEVSRNRAISRNVASWKITLRRHRRGPGAIVENGPYGAARTDRIDVLPRLGSTRRLGARPLSSAADAASQRPARELVSSLTQRQSGRVSASRRTRPLSCWSKPSPPAARLAADLVTDAFGQESERAELSCPRRAPRPTHAPRSTPATWVAPNRLHPPARHTKEIWGARDGGREGGGASSSSRQLVARRARPSAPAD